MLGDRETPNEESRKPPVSHVRGRLGEAMAALYLQLAGYRIVARNARWRHLEVDLVAARGHTIAFVEVRMRSSKNHGAPEESLRATKTRNLRRAAARLFVDLGFSPPFRMRLDVITVEFRGLTLLVRHLPGWLRPGLDGAPDSALRYPPRN